MNGLENSGITIIKGGTSSIVKDGSLDQTVMSDLTEDVGKLWHVNKGFVIVTSGARELGKAEGRTPNAAAANGQGKLIGHYIDYFINHGVEVGQLLVESMHFDVKEDDPKIGVIHRIVELLEGNLLPVVNENDPLARVETTLGNNDPLTAKIAIGLKEHGFDVNAVIFMSVRDGTAEQVAMGRGGPSEKAQAIADLQEQGITSLVVQGKDRHIIRDVFADEKVFIATYKSNPTL